MKVEVTYEDGVFKPRGPVRLANGRSFTLDLPEDEGDAQVAPRQRRKATGILMGEMSDCVGIVSAGGDAVEDKHRYYDDP